MAAPTYYEILGVAPAATQEAIRRAYRAKAKALHPDVSKAPDAHNRFAQLSTAYETLSDKGRRREYDLSLSQPSGQHSTAAHYTWTNIATGSAANVRDISEFDDIYETFFTNHSTKPAAPRSRAAKRRSGQ